MKTFKLLTLLAVLIAGTSTPALADLKAWKFGWWPGHEKWVQYKKYHPYLENGKHSQNTQWNEENWYVEDWVSQHGDAMELIDGFYKAAILQEQTVEDDKPILVVGPQFYRLGGLDKRRVVTTVDVVYGITENQPNRYILLKDWHTKRQIGVYTADGLQLE